MARKLYDAYKMVSSHEGTLFVYAFSYSIIVGIAPFLILAVIIAGNLFLEVESMIEIISHYIPADLIGPFISYIQEVAPSDIVLIVSLSLASLWVASRSVYSFLLESSRIDEISIQKLVLRLISMGYFLLIILGTFVVVFLLNYLPPYNYITIPLLLWLMMMSFYRLLSFRFTSFRDVYMGSAFATFGLLVMGKIFFVYINNYSNYASIYGPMASLMILLISCYFISYVIYLGFCINISFFDREMHSEDIKRKLAIRISNFSIRKFVLRYLRKED